MIERDPYLGPRLGGVLLKLIGGGFAIAMGVCVLTHTQAFDWTVLQELAAGTIGAGAAALVP